MLLLGTVLIFNFVAIVQGLSGRIVGGHDAPNHEYPYLVSLRNLEDKHFCGGSILNERWILTAAHCINKIHAKNYTISVGTNYLNETGDKYSVMFHVVDEHYEDFRYYDIALIRTTKKILFNDFVKTVSVAELNLSDHTLRVKLPGWGSTEYGRPVSNVLQEIELKLIPLEECRVKHRYVTSNHLCTFNKIGEGICKGDSGGPLVVEGIQIGIVSYIIPCAVGGPDVYTLVWSYKDWINSTIEKFDLKYE